MQDGTTEATKPKKSKEQLKADAEAAFEKNVRLVSRAAKRNSKGKWVTQEDATEYLKELGKKFTKSEYETLVKEDKISQDVMDICLSLDLIKKSSYSPKTKGEPRKAAWFGMEIATIADAFDARLDEFVAANEYDIKLLHKAGFDFMTYYRNQNKVGAKAKAEVPAAEEVLQ